jgi:ubiquinone/menaquinone biosynthesis C-methylase UbiE
MDASTSNRYHELRALIGETPTCDKVVLDLGAGFDPVTAPLQCRQKIMMDILFSTKPTLISNFLESIPLANESVDMVVAGEILEHITETRRFLHEIRRVLHDQGILILSVPNAVSLKYRIAFLAGRIPALAAKADYTYLQDNPAYLRGHVRDYSFAEIRHVLRDQGFHVVSERSIGLYFNGRRILPPWVMPVTFSDNIIVKAVLHK